MYLQINIDKGLRKAINDLLDAYQEAESKGKDTDNVEIDRRFRSWAWLAEEEEQE